MLNIRADPRVRLRIRGGTFDGIAREVTDGEEIERVRAVYCGAVNRFDYVECVFHRWQRPTRARAEELHESWFDAGVLVAVELTR